MPERTFIADEQRIRQQRDDGERFDIYWHHGYVDPESGLSSWPRERTWMRWHFDTPAVVDARGRYEVVMADEHDALVARLAEVERERKRAADMANDYMERWESAINDAAVLRARSDHAAPLLQLLGERDDLQRRYDALLIDANAELGGYVESLNEIAEHADAETCASPDRDRIAVALEACRSIALAAIGDEAEASS